MIPITYLDGDATQPSNEGRKLLVHVCNNKGGWGRGFVLSLSKRWKDPELKYREWFKSGQGFELGAVQYVKVEPDLVVVNMIAQDGYSKNGKPPIRYDALERCLEKVSVAAKKNKASVCLPYLMGCCLSGGKWETVESLIIKTISNKDIPVFVYKLV